MLSEKEAKIKLDKLNIKKLFRDWTDEEKKEVEELTNLILFYLDKKLKKQKKERK